MKLSRTHVVLFMLTVFTTLITGYTFRANTYDALLFSSSIILILGCHEMGHYYFGKKYNVDITPPYFIPAPPLISIIGTFGAFIKIKSPITSKRALFDIGIAGPIAGLVAAIPIMVIGLNLSEVVSINEINQTEGLFIITGDTLIYNFLSSLFMKKLPAGFDYLHHPMAFAGWIGLFVTALNLIPFGQLDGGHILYSLFSKNAHKFISYSMLFILLILGTGTNGIINYLNTNYDLDLINDLLKSVSFNGWSGWLVWGILLLFLGFKHPPTQTDHVNDLDTKRKLLGILALLMFIGCFTPVPLIISDSLR